VVGTSRRRAELRRREAAHVRVGPLERWRDIDREVCSGLPELFGHLLAWAEAKRSPASRGSSAAAADARDALETYDRGLAAMETSRQLHLAPGEGEKIIANRGIALTTERAPRDRDEVPPREP
jgi:hypothetical protein